MTPKHKLYPAMPYTSYRQMSREDSDAIYAYLMTQKPVTAPSVEADLRFPYNVRFAVRLWDMLFLKDTLPDASTGQSADWTRGRYLAHALGHCAECHTPRGAFGQMQDAKTLQGGDLGRIGAPDITPAALAARGWTGADLQASFATGIAKQGLDSCAGCHGFDGQGKPHVAVAMNGNSTLRQSDPRNLIA
ncbi:gluconate 2-dehydrogenase (acceptor) [Caballeronia pedi]|uniref:Gluconate 2-dehydrogenase (Acceptor) n=1 Tax=Caballeronia pedi TaxID=1777141 RepID=A0A158DLC5_9BURK|nr:gluconate 2-dehydrogenase (acceptor) [Caballeronia pedi]